MAVGFQIHQSLLDSYEVSKLSPRKFVRLFLAAAKGEQNLLSEFVKPWNGRLPQSEWAEIRSRIFARDDYTCNYCGARGVKLECDHVVPVAKGGRHDDDNLTTACFACNRSKRDKTIEEWRGVA